MNPYYKPRKKEGMSDTVKGILVATGLVVAGTLAIYGQNKFNESRQKEAYSNLGVSSQEVQRVMQFRTRSSSYNFRQLQTPKDTNNLESTVSESEEVQ